VGGRREVQGPRFASAGSRLVLVAGTTSEAFERLDENRLPVRAVYRKAMLTAPSVAGREYGERALESRAQPDRAELFRAAAAPQLDRAYRLAGLLLGDAHEAQDASQDAFLRAWRSFGTLRESSGFQPWFDKILINVCRDRLRRRGKVRFIDLEDAGSITVRADPFRAFLDRDEVIRAMASVEEEGRIVIVLHYWADLTLDAVADRTGWPVGTVKSRLNRALRAMRAQINPGFGAEAET
jgi:RNA polymerase sigma-70 factor, ECF subfamily